MLFVPVYISSNITWCDVLLYFYEVNHKRLFLSQFALKCNNYCISLMFFEFGFIKTWMSKDKDFEDSVVGSQFKKAN